MFPLNLQILFYFNFRKCSHYSFTHFFLSWSFLLHCQQLFFYLFICLTSLLTKFFSFYLSFYSLLTIFRLWFPSIALIWFSVLFVLYLLIIFFQSWNGISFVLNLFAWLLSPFLFFLILIRVQLFYNVLLISGGQQNESIIIYPLFFRFLSKIGHYRILSRVLCAIQ